MGTPGFEAAILDFSLPVWSDCILVDLIGYLHLENMGVAVKIMFLALLGTEI